MKTNSEIELPVLVTGAAGFLGGAVTEVLLSAGCRVSAVDMRLPARDSDWRERHGDRYGFMVVDLMSKDAAGRLPDGPYRAVVHLASYVPKSGPAPDAHEAARVHDGVLGITLRLLDAVRGKAGHLVLASSVSVYGGMRSGLIKEDNRPEPTDLYGVYKLACEGACGCFAAANKICLTNLRFAQIYGPGEPHGRILQNVLIAHAMNNQCISLVRGGRDERDFLWVDDAARAVLQVIDKRVPGTFNIASGVSKSIREIAEMIRDYSGTNFPLEIVDHGEPALIQKYDISAAKAAFDFVPAVDISEGLRRLCRR